MVREITMEEWYKNLLKIYLEKWQGFDLSGLYVAVLNRAKDNKYKQITLEMIKEKADGR